jgi:hypothetical protein
VSRPLWLPIASAFLAVLVWAILLGYVHAAAHIDNPALSIRPLPLSEAKKPTPSCTRLRTAIVVLRYKDGRILIAPMTFAVPC